MEDFLVVYKKVNHSQTFQALKVHNISRYKTYNLPIHSFKTFARTHSTKFKKKPSICDKIFCLTIDNAP